MSAPIKTTIMTIVFGLFLYFMSVNVWGGQDTFRLCMAEMDKKTDLVGCWTGKGVKEPQQWLKGTAKGCKYKSTVVIRDDKGAAVLLKLLCEDSHESISYK